MLDHKHSAETKTQLWCPGSPPSYRAQCNVKNFCLRGDDEHLKLSQLKRTGRGYVYTGNASKIFRVDSLNFTLKIRVLRSLKTQKLETVATADCLTSTSVSYHWKNNLFYVRPMEKPTNKYLHMNPVFGTTVSQQDVTNCLKQFLKFANSGHKTNPSLRAPGATELYEAEVPEKIIQERTGHPLLDSLRIYERTSDKQQRAVSNIQLSTSETTYSKLTLIATV